MRFFLLGLAALLSSSGLNGRADSTGDPYLIDLGLKYVVFKDTAGIPALSESELQEMISKINSVWGRCHIRFTIDQFLTVQPQDYGLSYQTANFRDLDHIRTTFSDDKTLLTVLTGAWNRGGTLGSSSANAWTSMPGGKPYGIIMEKPVRTNANLLAHELGHYLNLNHLTDAVDLMNPIIYSTSVFISENQCRSARFTALSYWAKAFRNHPSADTNIGRG